MPLELFENLRDGNVDPKELLENQIRFKSKINEIKIGGNKLEDKTNTIKNINFFGILKIINLFRDYSFLVSEAKYKALWKRV